MDTTEKESAFGLPLCACVYAYMYVYVSPHVYACVLIHTAAHLCSHILLVSGLQVNKLVSST